MSKLEKLIQELCPNGVEYKTLGEIATDMYRGSGITRDQITETGTPCVRYGEKITHPILIPSFPANIPTSESLNVSIATAIVLAEFRRQI